MTLTRRTVLAVLSSSACIAALPAFAASPTIEQISVAFREMPRAVREVVREI